MNICENQLGRKDRGNLMIDLATILDLLRVEGKQKIYIIDEDGTPLEYGVDDISFELDSKVSELVIYDNYVEIDLDYY